MSRRYFVFGRKDGRLYLCEALGAIEAQLAATRMRADGWKVEVR